MRRPARSASSSTAEHGLGGDDSSGGAAGGGAEVKRNKKRHENVRVADDLFKDGISDKPLRANATEYERRRQQMRQAPVFAYKQALLALERAGDALGVATTLCGLARAQVAAADGDKSDLQRVAKTYERAIQIFEKELGKDHATVINTLFAMSAVLDDAGESTKAGKARGAANQRRARSAKDVM